MWVNVALCKALFIALVTIWESNCILSFSLCFAFCQIVRCPSDLQESSVTTVLSTFRVGGIRFLKGGDLLTCRLRQPSSSSRAPSTDLPTWQQNTFTYKDFYYFYLISSRPQPWKSASPTLKDARTRNAAVSASFCSFVGEIGRISRMRDPDSAASHKLRLISRPVADRYQRPRQHPLLVPDLCNRLMPF